MNKITKLIFYNTLVFLILIIVIFFLTLLIEVISGRYISKNKLDCSYLQCNANYKYINRSRDAILRNEYEVYYDVIYQKDEYGFRGRKKDVSQIDILTIGGSTTDEKFLNLEDTWSHQLELNFRSIGKDIDVVNAGIDGQSSHGHIWNLKNWFPKIDNFNSKYIIFYMGINENLKDEANTKFDLYNDNLTFKEKIKYYIQRNNGLLYKSYNIIVKKYYNLYMNQGYHILIPEYSKPKYKFIPTKQKQENLKNNLLTIKKLTKELKAIPIFVTQRTRYWKKIDNEILLANNSIYNNRDYYNFEKFISETIIEFCEKNNIFCIDIFKNINFEIHDHFELVHTTASGSKKIADYIFKKLYKNYRF